MKIIKNRNILWFLLLIFIACNTSQEILEKGKSLIDFAKNEERLILLSNFVKNNDDSIVLISINKEEDLYISNHQFKSQPFEVIKNNLSAESIGKIISFKEFMNANSIESVEILNDTLCEIEYRIRLNMKLNCYYLFHNYNESYDKSTDTLYNGEVFTYNSGWRLSNGGCD